MSNQTESGSPPPMHNFAKLPLRAYDLEEPEAYVDRYEFIHEASVEPVAEKEQDVNYKRYQDRIYGRKLGLGRSAYDKGMSWVGGWDHFAYEELSIAASWLYTPALFELDRLFERCAPGDLGLDAEEFCREARQWRELAETAAWTELEDALLTGTRPVLWQVVPAKPCAHNARFGKGSLFVVAYKGYQFAITSKHVVDDIDPTIFRLLLPDSQDILPVFLGNHSINGAAAYRDDREDIFAWRIRVDHPGTNGGWWSWMMADRVRPASDLIPGQRLYAVGFPEFDENIDIDAFDIVEHPFIASGRLIAEQISDETLSMELDSNLPAVELNGMSGGPVFARFAQIFHYVGMNVRGGGTPPTIHFIGSEYVLRYLDRIIAEEDSDTSDQEATASSM
ncbi:hypothetical protein ALO95_200282 [Pseudomonas syringae pv. antirrhini]|uniref:trypsin-like peptidase domain-containing protein n=1 Tax=Pseudomonas syringae group genomosp. 3 TaxID=251701 RepID=UPI000F3B9DEE|nr:trypsin-like peptidase domain-containing protein [Pseudomonas syringae group genomosp. 3]RMP38296.1 hypothetical protein ALQ23_200175 [Pseudomonas syringae pv. antirrhini]RMW26863.1 hypothetical protein ALO95_200282 [Pseudomonas syringae pv. antirrhini]